MSRGKPLLNCPVLNRNYAFQRTGWFRTDSATGSVWFLQSRKSFTDGRCGMARVKGMCVFSEKQESSTTHERSRRWKLELPWSLCAISAKSSSAKVSSGSSARIRNTNRGRVERVKCSLALQTGCGGFVFNPKQVLHRVFAAPDHRIDGAPLTQSLQTGAAHYSLIPCRWKSQWKDRPEAGWVQTHETEHADVPQSISNLNSRRRVYNGSYRRCRFTQR